MQFQNEEEILSFSVIYLGYCCHQNRKQDDARFFTGGEVREIAPKFPRYPHNKFLFLSLVAFSLPKSRNRTRPNFRNAFSLSRQEILLREHGGRILSLRLLQVQTRIRLNRLRKVPLELKRPSFKVKLKKTSNPKDESATLSTLPNLDQFSRVSDCRDAGGKIANAR